MSRRRPTFEANPVAPIEVIWATPDAPKSVAWAVNGGRTPAGHCPKCGEYIGRQAMIRAHAKTCQVEIVA